MDNFIHLYIFYKEKWGADTRILEEAFHMTLTATATKDSLDELAHFLNYKDAIIVSENVERQNSAKKTAFYQKI